MTTIQEAHELCKQGKAVLIDCREECELQETGLAEGALWMPLSGLVEDTDAWRAFKASLPRDKKIFLYCKVGGRAGRMAEFLCCDGFEASCLGGLCDWKGAGLPVKPFNNK